jgi:hypothetical protein
MNPRAEAEARLGGRYAARVLEPSPPAVSQPPWYADDPVARGEVTGGRPVVSPVATGDLSWTALVAQDAGLAEWCRERWLGATPPLRAVPAGLVTTRTGLHRLAESVLAPARQQVNGKLGLRWTRGGFGTPFFGPDRQVRVDGLELVAVDAQDERRAPITTLAAAARHLGPDWLPGDPDLDDEPLALDGAAASFIGEFFGLATRVLETLRASATAEQAPSRVQLWPEHFDIALELGAGSAGARAAYGLSPGDESHAEPYLYVAPWQAPAPGDLWQAEGFSGAELAYATLAAADDAVSAALAFFAPRRDALAG